MFSRELLGVGLTGALQFCLFGSWVLVMSRLIDTLVAVEDSSSLQTGMCLAAAYSLLLVSSQVVVNTSQNLASILCMRVRRTLSASLFAKIL